MTLQQWADHGWLKKHRSSRQEIADLLAIVERDLKDANYLDVCRVKRNTVEYDRSGAASHGEAQELIAFVEELRGDVLAWLRRQHPELVS